MNITINGKDNDSMINYAKLIKDKNVKILPTTINLEAVQTVLQYLRR